MLFANSISFGLIFGDTGLTYFFLVSGFKKDSSLQRDHPSSQWIGGNRAPVNLLPPGENLLSLRSLICHVQPNPEQSSNLETVLSENSRSPMI